MILADKIIKLRKQFGWSQENLADALDVSRQSVSKWESGNSIPDLVKILKMAEIFGVTTDYLLKDEIETVETNLADRDSKVVKLTMDEVNAYVEEKVKSAKLISKGVMLCIYSIIPLFIMLGLSETNMLRMNGDVAVLIGLTLLLVTVSAGVAVLIHSNQYQLTVEKLEGVFELSYGIEGVYKEKLAKYLPSFNRVVSITIVMFILSVLPLLYAGLISRSNALPLFMLALMFALVGFGVHQLINVNARKNAYEVILKQGEYTPESYIAEKQSERLSVVYWPIAVAIYLGWSLWTNDWHITWIVWPVAGLLFAALTGLAQILRPAEK